MQLETNKKYTLVQYIGDCSLYKPRPHGNSRNDRVYKRTAPSTIAKAENDLISLTSSSVYKKQCSEKIVMGEQQGILTPRNSYQIQYLQKKLSANKRLGPDPLGNLFELYYNLPGFIKDIQVIPDFSCIMFCTDIVNVINTSWLNSNICHPLLFSYDTTFNMGDLYVSVLVVRVPIFKGNPVAPVAFMLHDRKFTDTHRRFITIICKELPLLNSKICVFIIDREKALTNSIKEILPKAAICYCWNHLLRDITLAATS